MVAQDTGSAITGPARADIYYGAGPDAGRISGRFRHNMRFVMLVPKSLDPVARGRNMPLPDPRPSEKIAKLFPQIDPPKETPKEESGIEAKPPAAPAVAAQPVDSKVPLPEPRPVMAPERKASYGPRQYRRGP
jgi:membrane-bound lytic murein transglycosylase A